MYALLRGEVTSIFQLFKKVSLILLWSIFIVGSYRVSGKKSRPWHWILTNKSFWPCIICEVRTVPCTWNIGRWRCVWSNSRLHSLRRWPVTVFFSSILLLYPYKRGTFVQTACPQDKRLSQKWLTKQVFKVLRNIFCNLTTTNGRNIKITSLWMMEKIFMS